MENNYDGVSKADANTINGAWAENRGRRGDQVRLDNPFENGELSNWNKGPRGYTRSDERVFDQVCGVLAQDPHLDASAIEVKVESGIVTLSGKVENRRMKQHAEYLIEHIFGVRDVQNTLEFEKR